MDFNKIIDNICHNFGKLPEDTAKRKFGSLPVYTYRDVLSRILEGNNSSITEVFPEMSRPTIVNMLKVCFPGKVKEHSGQDWYVYLLDTLNLKRCSKCTNILDKTNFYVAVNKHAGLRNMCITCDNTANKLHRDLNKEHYKKTHHQHYVDNKQAYVAKTAKRRAVKLNALVSWANTREIATIYLHCPEGYHVDHIIPLQGDLVCGLHCEHNLQYLTAVDNISKGNKFDIDTYIHSISYTPPYKL